MIDRDLIADYTRVRVNGKITHIDVALVTWHTQREPVLEWTSYRSWQKPPSPERVYNTRLKAIRDPRFFRVCATCGQRQNRGHMHSPKLCRSCAETHLGIVY